MTSDTYSEQEKQEMIQAMGSELREAEDQELFEKFFRRRLAILGYNATDIDQIIDEAMKPT